ncbi:MAG: hypothetical protein AABO58_00065 [Acidobacteriota bacterium]
MADVPDVEQLAKRVSALEKHPKDNWDRASVIIAALVPVTIAALSAVVTRQGNQIAAAQVRVAEAQVQLGKNQHAAQLESANIAARVEKAKLVRDYVDILLSKKDRTRAALGARGLVLGLPSEGPELIKELDVINSETAKPAIGHGDRPAVFPILVGTAHQVTCVNRGGVGTKCVQRPGEIITPPPERGVGIFQATIPVGARWLTGTLTEYSGSSCNGGAAIAEILIDGVSMWREELLETKLHPFKVPIPAGAKLLELRTDSADPSPFCDDPDWQSVTYRRDL